MKCNPVNIGKITFAAVEEKDGARLIRTVVKLVSADYNVYGGTLYISKDGREYEFKHIPSTYSGVDRNIAPLVFRETEYFSFDYIGCDIYSNLNSE
ncbi:hypothetical protein RRH01S_22_01030 [Rhizobium rhizogenes NBRC 13257]|uniref:Uncharacterized protein n=1 Tax=Rhizobium rhizogenes NBRC 13257 TaxID=1220581 RepID=A0AA87UCL6_RHIRH|nr:hypothetical protein RRH01S_22_01030 [Rhizobium rhizogenes NBRC 13257]